ncbi:MAG: sigma-70 family RNA polymerase sigma factor [Planctomycetota bacterium]
MKSAVEVDGGLIDGSAACGEEGVKGLFLELVDPHEKALFAAALRFTSNRADAEDLLQETLMRAYVGFKRCADIDQPRAWLFKIMTNAYINRYHKKRRRPPIVSYEDSLDHRIDRAYAGADTDPQERFFAQFLDTEIKQALEGLPEHFRHSVILCDVSGLSYVEISRVLDCSLGTVRSRISRGREMLFRRLYEYAREKGLIPRDARNARRRELVSAAR